MKPKVYKLAAMAVLLLTAIGPKTFAQTASSSSSSSSSNTPAPAASGQNSSSSYYYSTAPATVMGLSSVNGAYTIAPLAGNMYFDTNMLQDSTYRKKMRDLQKQMSDLQKEMSTLRTEEMKKNSEEMRKRYAEQTKVYAESFKNFDQKFNQKFQSFGQNMHFNFDKMDTDIEKKVQSGEVKLKTKSYSKSYSVDGNDNIKIENSFGKITVNTWARNEVKVDVEIKAYANEDDDAQKLLDQIKVNDSKDNNAVNFTTVMGDEDHKNTFWGTMTSNGKTTVRKAVVNYTVYMPAKNPLTINNRFGAVILPELSGKVELKNSYGAVVSKALTSPGNVINVRYGDARFESLTNSDVTIAYGSLDLPYADKLNANIQFSPAKIGKLSTSGTFTLRYGEGLQIGNLDKNLKTLSVTSSFAPVKLASLNNDNADFDVTVQNGGFTYDNGVTVTSKSPGDDDRHWSRVQTYKGHIGKGNSDKVITIKTNYSSVKFDQ